MQQTEVAAATRTATAPATEFDRLLQGKTFTPQDLLDGDNLDRLERIAERMASGRMTVPEYLRGNAGDCMAIAMQAMLWNMDPFAVAQKTHIVSGKLGYEAQLVNAVLQNSGAIRGLPRYEYRGEGPQLECRVGCTPRGETEILWGEWLMKSSITTQNSSLWKTNPRQQIGYLQIKNWARAFAPGAILGVYTVDELLDAVGDAPVHAAAPAPAPTAQAAKSELGPYPQADFAKNLPSWRGIVESGRKTPVELIAMVETKGVLNDKQREQILKLGQAVPAAEPEPVQDEFVAAMEAAEGGAQ